MSRPLQTEPPDHCGAVLPAAGPSTTPLALLSPLSALSPRA
ncbi:hypothetical protein ACFV6D_07530 [Kitasatospora sp. NPDC059812]